MSYIIELEKGVFIADIEGDPGRTLKKENAERFRLKVQAEANLTVIRKRYGRPFCDAEILEVV